MEVDDTPSFDLQQGMKRIKSLSLATSSFLACPGTQGGGDLHKLTELWIEHHMKSYVLDQFNRGSLSESMKNHLIYWRQVAMEQVDARRDAILARREAKRRRLMTSQVQFICCGDLCGCV